MDFKDKIKKYWVPGVAGALVVVGVVTGVIVFIVKSSGKVESVKKDQQSKELKDDPCETLLKDYLKAMESGASKAKLKRLFAEGSRKCPKDFILPSQQEVPKVEEIRARLAQKEAERNVDGVNKADKSEETESVSGDTETAQTFGSKGKKNASDSGKLATVPKAKSDVTKIVNKAVDTSHTTKDEKGDKTPEVPNPTGTKPTELGDKPAPVVPPTPKEKRANAWKECMKMIAGIEESGTSDLIDGFTRFERNRIEKLVKEGLLPKFYDSEQLVTDYWKGKMLKFIKAGKDKEAQEALDKVKRNEDVTEMNDYRFLKAIANNDMNEAKILLEEHLFLPIFIRDDLIANPAKLKFLKNLNDSQMDALLEYCKWNGERDLLFSDYNYAEGDCEIADKKAEYNAAVEKMRLLQQDIHKDFDFAIPEIQEKKSCMHDLEEYLRDKEKLPGFDDAFKELRGDRNRDIALVINAVVKLSNGDDQIKFLQTMEKLYNENLIDVIISVLKREEFAKYNIQKCLSRADQQDEQSLPNINRLIEWITSRTTDELDLACLTFWKLSVILVDNFSKLKVNDDQDQSNHDLSFWNRLRNLSDGLSPLDISKLGSAVSIAEFGVEAMGLVEQCALCIRTRAKKDPNPLHEAQSTYANAYLTIYKKVNGANMNAVSERRASAMHYLAVEPQVVIDLLNSEEVVLKLTNWPLELSASHKKNAIALLNSKIIGKLQEQKSKAGEPLKQASMIELQVEEWMKVEKVSKILKRSNNEKKIALVFLELCPINQLLSYLHSNVYCEWKPKPIAKQVSLAEITALFDEYSKDVTNKTAEQNFLDAAEEYVKGREQQIMNQIKTSLNL